ncbi:MAG: hypothetical protein HMLKMBBP_01408 [Planctomycetes bacterium]|nr:hypothetical protein [Planctomycetota bacterium]
MRFHHATGVAAGRAMAVAAFAALAALGAEATPAFADDAAPAREEAAAAVVQTEAPAGPPKRAVLFEDTFVDDASAAFQKWKKDTGIPLSLYAIHVWHMNREHRRNFIYGREEARGTLLYAALLDPEITADDGTKMGLHAEFRFRDHDDRFRPFINHTAWFWELYAWIDTDWGRLKAGQIWKRFGFDWDTSWWGTIGYYNGQKFDPDRGVSLEKTYQWDERTKIDAFTQVFVDEDRVNGSFPFADPEWNPHEEEDTTINLRALATRTICAGEVVQLGLSAQYGEIERDGIHDEHTKAAAIDAAYVTGPLRVFGELARETGVRGNPHYLSGGPSDERTETTIGASYQMGPIQVYGHRTAATLHDPGARSVMYLGGVTAAVTQNVDFMIHYVKWMDRPQGGVVHQVPIEDSWQFIVMWRF